MACLVENIHQQIVIVCVESKKMSFNCWFDYEKEREKN